MWGFIRKTALVLAITAALYLVVDLAAGLVLGPLHRATPDFTAIPGFRDQPYATPGFAFEYTEMQSFDTVLGTRLLMPALRHGTYYNVDRLPPTEANYRRTINPADPRKPTRLVLVVGGSLVAGPAVPDSLTIPSLLAQRLNEEDPDHGYEVLNAGVDGAVSAQELARLRYELSHGLKPDLVVVIDGPVDFAQGVYEGEPGGLALSGRGLIGELIHRYLPLNIYDWLRFRPAELLALVECERITGMSVVPTMIGMLLAEPALGTADISSLRVINYGGSPMPVAVLTRFMERLPHVAFGQSYGMTELSPIATHLSPADHRAGGPRLASAGRAVTTAEIGIMDEGDRLLPPGAAGEVVVRGPIVMQGYWRQPELTARTVRAGWMHTGDVGYLDEAGYLFIVDRKKDMIVSGGENVYSIEVEDAIHRHPAVAQCAVIGVPHASWGEAVHAVVVLRAGHALELEELVQHCRAHIAGFKCPRSLELRAEALPLSGVNKVNKALLREPHWRGQVRGVS